jgi:O-antigen ligase
MTSEIRQSKLAPFLAWGALAVTLMVTDRINSDPVNVSKMLVLSVVGFGSLALIPRDFKSFVSINRKYLAPILVFLLFSTISIFNSANPIEKGLFGANGRNTGLISYFALCAVFVSSLTLSSMISFQKVLKGLFLSAVVNIILCLLSASGNEVFMWENKFNAVLGTFGNPNFIGAFMGIFVSLLAVQILSNQNSVVTRIAFLGLTFLGFYVIYLSHALQGTAVALIGISLSILFKLRSLEKFRKIYLAFLSLSSFVGMLAALGLFQIGPLAPLIYKSSLSYRLEYWKSGLNMAIDHIWFGVGMDSYGNYYRTYRSVAATIRPGVDTSTDSAHNVFIDIFSGTGIFPLIAYIFLIFLISYSAIKHLKINKNFDPVFYSLLVTWLGYQIQSMISINQLGLAVWGWLLGGSLVAYTKLMSSTSPNTNLAGKDNSTKNHKRESQQIHQLDAGTTLKLFAFMLLGFLISILPFVQDAKFRNFQSGKGSPEQLVSLVQSWPLDATRINKAVFILAKNNFVLEASQVAAFGAIHFPNDYISWSQLYEISESGTPQKSAYKSELHKIDPFNPRYFE